MKKLISILLLLGLAETARAELPSIAVADFSCDRRTDLTRGLPDLLAEALVNSKRFDVYEREKLGSIMREQGLQSSGFVDPQSAVALGNVAGVRYILTGKIVDFGREARNFRGYGVNTTTTFHRLKASIRIVDVRTGRLAFIRTEEAEEKESSSQGLRISDTTVDARLVGKVAASLAKALLEDDSFAPAEAAAPALASVTIASVPEKADVEVDGVFYGNAGGAIELPAGMRTVTVSLPGYEPWSKKVLVREGLSITATLARKVDVSVEIKSE